jgi:hypothetical protein
VPLQARREIGLEFFVGRAALKAASWPPQSDPVVLKFDAGQSAASDTSAIQWLEVARSLDRSLQRIADDGSAIRELLRRIADKADPQGDARPVGTPYVAKLLGQTPTWVAEMARVGTIPKGCVVAGTGNGKSWKFHRSKIDEWIKNR